MSARSEAAARARAIRTRRIEAIALGVLALLPVVPHVTFLLRAGVPRFGLVGDLALVEQAVRHVWTGDALLGARSRYEWNHPGPLLFYLCAPFQRIFGESSTGVFVGTCVVNALCAGGLVASTRLFARRAHAIAALLVVLAWFVAFGNVAANPWSPAVVTLPLMAFLTTAAMLARGKSGALYVSVLFGALAAQTYAAALPVVTVIGTGSLVAFLVGARRRGGLERVERWRLMIATSVLAVLFVPPLVEQLVAPRGNVSEMLSFVARHAAPDKPLALATMNWTTATSWLPERLARRSIVDEGLVPLVLRLEPMPGTVSAHARILAIIHVTTVAVAAIVAARRRDVVSLALLAIGLVADGIAVVLLHGAVGSSPYFFAFWTTAASSVAWTGVLSTLFAAIGAIAPRAPRVSGVIAPALVVIGLSTAVTATSLQRFWIARHATAPSTRPDLRPHLGAIAAALRARAKQEGTIVVLHREGAKEIADAMALELEKDGVDVRVANADRDAFVGVRTANGVANPLHAWFATPAQPLRLARCTEIELVAQTSQIAAYGSRTETPSCVGAK